MQKRRDFSAISYRIFKKGAVGLAALSVGLMTGISAHAAGVSGEIVMVNWLGGSEAEMMKKLEADFVAKNPDVTFRDILPQTGGNIRGGIRQVLLGGEKADILIDTWPSLRKEFIDAGMLQPVDDIWNKYDMGSNLAPSWKALTSTGGKNYGVTYTFGDRSGVWYKTATMEKAGITPPETWDEFIASFDKLRAVGVTPISMPAKVWAHAEWFETLYARVNGLDMARKLIRHEIPWTDASVKATFDKWAELLKANCCDAPDTMMALNWDNSTDAVLKAGDAGYVLLGMWLNTRAKNEYGEEPGKDYNIFQFPAMGLGHDDVSIVDSKDLELLSTAQNVEAAGAFMNYMLSRDATAIMAGYGMPSPSKQADSSLYDPVVKNAVAEVTSAADVESVLGDQLPSDLNGEYRVQLQKFLMDPSDDNISSVMAAIEAAAAGAY